MWCFCSLLGAGFSGLVSCDQKGSRHCMGCRHCPKTRQQQSRLGVVEQHSCCPKDHDWWLGRWVWCHSPHRIPCYVWRIRCMCWVREFKGTYGVELAELVGVMMTIGHVPSGRGRRPSLQDDRRSLLRKNLVSFLLSNEAVDWDRSL